MRREEHPPFEIETIFTRRRSFPQEFESFDGSPRILKSDDKRSVCGCLRNAVRRLAARHISRIV